MKEPQFTYGSIALGCYTALLWFTLLLGWVAPNLLSYYVPLLIFLGIGLKPLIIYSGLYKCYQSFMATRDEKQDNKIAAQKQLEIDRKERSLRLRRSRIRDPQLPKDW